MLSANVTDHAVAASDLPLQKPRRGDSSCIRLLPAFEPMARSQENASQQLFDSFHAGRRCHHDERELGTSHYLR